MASRLGLGTLLGVAPQVQGLERLPRGAMIVAFNHLAPVDPFVVAWVLAGAGHTDPVVLLRDDVPRIPLVSRLLDAGTVRLDDVGDRGPHDGVGSEAFAQAREQLAAGRPVLIAPERGVSPSLELMPLRSGAARLAEITGAPLVPVGLFGTHRLFDGDRYRRRRGLPVTVVFGHPVAPGSPARVATRLLHLDMEALYEQALDDYPDREVGEAGADWWPARRGGAAPTVAQVIEVRAADGPAPTDADPGTTDQVSAEVWCEDAATDETAAEEPPGPPVAAMAHAELLAHYPRSYHRNAAQQGGRLRDLKAVLAFDRPGQPHEHHPVVHLDHHVDGRVTVHWDGGGVTLQAVELSASPVRVVVYGRLADDHPHGATVLPAGTLTTLLGVPQGHRAPDPLADWETVRSIHLQA